MGVVENVGLESVNECTLNEDNKLIKKSSLQITWTTKLPSVKPSTMTHDHFKGSCILNSVQGHSEDPWDNK